MNNRANIMYFIEHLCDMAQRENHLDFVRMMQRDILRVVDAVAPSDGSGAANVKVVRRVSSTLIPYRPNVKQSLTSVRNRCSQASNKNLSSSLIPSSKSKPASPNAMI